MQLLIHILLRDCQDRKTQNLFGFKGLAATGLPAPLTCDHKARGSKHLRRSLPLSRNGSHHLTADAIVGTWFLSDTEDRQNGLRWYNNAHAISERIAAELGFSVDQIAGAIAALSPNNKWERNCQDAENLARAIKAGIDTDSVKVCTFGNNKAKAIKILSSAVDSAEIVSILRGQKVVAFYLNIARNGDTDCPVIDGHAFNIARGTVG